MCRVPDILNRFLIIWRTLKCQIVAYWNFRHSNVFFPLAKCSERKRLDNEVKPVDGKCEKWELSCEPEIPVWKFYGIILLSAVEILLIHWFDKVSQNQVCHSAQSVGRSPTCTQVLWPGVTEDKYVEQSCSWSATALTRGNIH